MLQDIFPHRYDITYHHTKPQQGDPILYFDHNSVLIRQTDGMIDFPLFDGGDDSDLLFLFSVDDRRFFIRSGDTLPDLPGCEPYPFAKFRDALPQHLAFAGITASQLNRWYRNHRFCGCCGKPMAPSALERAMICDSCQITEYPRISPAVIIAVTDGDRLVLSRYANREYKRHALIAGFCEVGETVEDTVHREVREEIGLEVENLRYYKSQPWPFSDSLLMGFFCSVKGSREIRVDQMELEYAAWYEREDLPGGASNISLTQEMIEAFREGKEPK